ncbi:MAG: hypothetical protein ABIP35_07025 [Ginsengibacter sp.]
MKTQSDITPEEFEILEQYLTNEMSSGDREEFSKKLNEDPILQQKLYSVKLILTGIQESTLQKRVEEYHQDLHPVTKNISASSSKVFSIKQWLVAASILVIAGITALLYFTAPEPNQKLFSQYFKPDPGLINSMGVSDNYIFDRAMIDYKTGEYAKAVIAWEKLLKENSANDTLNYFLGSANLALDKNDKAISYFSIVLSNENSAFYNDAKWYTGLALLKEDKNKEAIPFIEKSEHPNREELLKKLEASK